MEQTLELLQKWDARARRLHPRMEIFGEGLMLGAGTVLAGKARDEGGRPRLALDEEPRVLALLSTAYGRPVAAQVMAKMRRAAEIWNDGEKALAHIHLAYARLPPCGEEQALRLFVAADMKLRLRKDWMNDNFLTLDEYREAIQKVESVFDVERRSPRAGFQAAFPVPAPVRIRFCDE